MRRGKIIPQSGEWSEPPGFERAPPVAVEPGHDLAQRLAHQPGGGVARGAEGDRDFARIAARQGDLAAFAARRGGGREQVGRKLGQQLAGALVEGVDEADQLGTLGSRVRARRELGEDLAHRLVEPGRDRGAGAVGDPAVGVEQQREQPALLALALDPSERRELLGRLDLDPDLVALDAKPVRGMREADLEAAPDDEAGSARQRALLAARWADALLAAARARAVGRREARARAGRMRRDPRGERQQQPRSGKAQHRAAIGSARATAHRGASPRTVAHSHSAVGFAAVSARQPSTAGLS